MSWFRLFTTFPEAAETQVGSTGNRLLLEDWRQFNETTIQLRATLKQQNPTLFIHYMAANP